MRSDEASSGLISISLIQRLLHHQSLKRTSNCSSAAKSTGLRPRTPCSALKIWSAPSIAGPAWCSVAASQCAVLIHLHQLVHRPEQQDRAELRVDAAAEDQLVAVGRDHGLHRHATENVRAGLLANGF